MSWLKLKKKFTKSINQKWDFYQIEKKKKIILFLFLLRTGKSEARERNKGKKEREREEKGQACERRGRERETRLGCPFAKNLQPLHSLSSFSFSSSSLCFSLLLLLLLLPLGNSCWAKNERRRERVRSRGGFVGSVSFSPLFPRSFSGVLIFLPSGFSVQMLNPRLSSSYGKM